MFCLAQLFLGAIASLGTALEALALAKKIDPNTNPKPDPSSPKSNPDNKPNPVPLFVSSDPLRVWDNILASDVWGPLVRPAYETYDMEAFMT